MKCKTALQLYFTLPLLLLLHFGGPIGVYGFRWAVRKKKFLREDLEKSMNRIHKN